MPIAEALVAKGFEVVIGYGELGGADLELLKKKGFRAKFVPMQRGGISFFKDLKSIYHIWKFFKKEKPDITHLVTIKPYLYGGIISRLTNVPGVVSAVSGLGTLFIADDLKSRLIRNLLYPIYKLAFNHSNQKIIVQNKDDSDEFKQWGVLDLSKVRLIKSSGVNMQKFIYHEEPDGIITICFAARLLRDKGVYEFINAAKVLKEKGIKARFLLAGQLDVNNPSSLNLNDLNLIKKEKNVEVLGHHKDVPKLYQRSHIVCLPSYREGLPKSLIEASAACRAIVTTDVPGCRDAIISNKTGLLVPVRNSKRLADALQWLIENPKERIAMGHAGRKFVEQEFSIEKVVLEHLNTYQEIIKKNQS